ncbi:hypothetical protein ACHWQZ_G004427 [Mnemiopsis leidyi]
MVLILLISSQSDGVKVDVKVVDSHSQIGQGQSGLYRPGASKLTASRKPAALCAHPALAQIVGKCYDIEVAEYKYVVCPFHNITQHEVALKWNAYHGILGIWSHWNYDDHYSTFTHGHYTDGDTCTKDDKTILRTALLYHTCGKQTRVVSVGEPDTCAYNITLESPLFCHKVFSDVYNALPENERKEFSLSTLEFKHNILTDEGLKEERRKILDRIGCLNMRKEFKNLEECEKEYNNLNKEHKELGEKCSLEADDNKYSELQTKYDELKRVVAESGLVFPDDL